MNTPKVLKSGVILQRLRMKFEELAKIWLRDHAEIHKAPSSVMRDKQMLRDHILPAIGHVAIEALERKDFTNLQGRLTNKGKLSPNSEFYFRSVS